MTTTATTLQLRLGRYQHALVTINTLLLMVGLTLMFFALHLVVNQHMARLDFFSDWLSIFPLTVLILGVLTVLFSLLGVLSTACKNKYALLVYACLMACLVIPQFFSTYASIRAKEDTDERGFEKNIHVLKMHISKAFQSDDTEAISAWDRIQEDLRCCGSDLYGYKFWNGLNNSYDLRESCCVRHGDNSCPWKGFFKEDGAYGDAGADLPIYKTGCLTVLDILYEKEVIPLLQPVFLLASIMVAVLEIAAVAFAVGYVAVLRRREQKFGYAGDNGHTDTPF